MRIIAGEHRGRTLRAPKGDGTRPTTDRVRESLMSAISSARGGFEGAVVLDAFAGSGALGLEALSRGAEQAHFYEKDGAAARVLTENCATLGYAGRGGNAATAKARVRREDVLKTPPVHARPAFNLVLLDPPYALDPKLLVEFLEALNAADALAADTLITYEHDVSTNAAVDEAFESSAFRLRARKKYGNTALDFFERTNA